jgi:hypothetical protein
MPAWRKGAAVGQWIQIPNSALSSAPIAVQTYPALGGTGPESKEIAWTGFSLDVRDSSVYSAANGGHNDYAGNEVNRIRLSDDAPSWTEPRAATPVSQVTNSTAHYADGRPTSRHSYYGSVFSEVRGRAMVFAGARYGDGYVTPSVDAFNPGTNDWDQANTIANVPGAFSGSQGSALAIEKSTGNVYTFSNWSIDRWNTSSNTWTNLKSGSAIYGQGAATAVDTARNRILVVGGDNGDHAIYDIATNTATTVSFTGAGAGAMSGTGNGMVYDPLLDDYLFRTAGAGGTVYRINAQTFAVDTLTTSNGSGVQASTNGVWTRFLYVPQLKGVVYFPAFTSNGWFLRTN